MARFPAESILHTVVRFIVGLTVLVGAVNGWVYIFTDEARFITPGARTVADAMMDTGYTYHLLKAVELAGSLLLLLNVWRPLAIVMLTPVSISILMLHLKDLKGLPVALVLMAGLTYLYMKDWKRITSILNEHQHLPHPPKEKL